MKIFLWGLLALVILLLITPIRLTFFADNQGQKATLWLYGIKLKLLPKKPAKQKKSQPKKEDAPKRDSAKKDKPMSLDFLLSMLKSAFSGISFLSRRLHFNKLCVQIEVGKDEPDETAIFFGQVNGALYTALGVLSSIFKVKYDHVKVSPNFLQRCFDYKISFSFWAMPVTILSAGAIALIRFLRLNAQNKQRQIGGNVNERASN